MEMVRLRDIVLGSDSKDLLAEVDLRAKEINELRPLDSLLARAVEEAVIGERVYSSNAIEGNTLTFRETEAILKAGHVRADFERKREAAEVLNLAKAIELAQGLSSSDQCSRSGILAVHRQLLSGIHDDWAGRLRHENVMVTGARHQPPDPSHVPGALDDVFGQLSGALEDVHPIVVAAWAHWAIARIHPFRDGNGRMARLWQDLLLFRRRLTCATIRPQDRRLYYECLERADDGQIDPLVQLVCERVADMFEKYSLAKARADQIDQWAESVVSEAHARTDEKKKLQYIRWRRVMERLRFEFERCATSVTQHAANIEIQVVSKDLIDQSAWERLCSGATVPNTGFFKVSFRKDHRLLRYFFFFGKHFWSDIDSESERSALRASLLMSEQSGDRPAERLDTRSDGVLPKEIFPVEDSLLVRRYDPLKQQDFYERNADPMSVAQSFIQGVLLKRLA